MQSENGTKFETVIETKLVEQVEQGQINITNKVDDKLKCMKDEICRRLEIERRRGKILFFMA